MVLVINLIDLEVDYQIHYLILIQFIILSFLVLNYWFVKVINHFINFIMIYYLIILVINFYLKISLIHFNYFNQYSPHCFLLIKVHILHQFLNLIILFYFFNSYSKV